MNASASPITPPLARTTWLQFTADYPVVDAVEAALVWDDFGEEMQQYCEILLGHSGPPIGIMFRGQGEAFTAKALRWLERWEMSADDIAYYQEMARIYQHTNAFLKLEWHPDGQRQISAYFRRRPPLRRVLHYYFQMGIDKEALRRILWVAQTLQKETVHFVAASFRKNSPLRHKLYFSQHVTPYTFATVVGRVLNVLNHFSIPASSQNDFLLHHPQLCPPDRESSLFLSLAFDDKGLQSSFKLDYSDVAPGQVQHFLGTPALRPTPYEDLCAKVDSPFLSNLGLRFIPDGPPQLKFYADLYRKA